MANRKNKSSRRKPKVNAKLATLFKMSREQLNSRKLSGGGTHRTYKDTPRTEQKRRAIDDQMDPRI